MTYLVRVAVARARCATCFCAAPSKVLRSHRNSALRLSALRAPHRHVAIPASRRARVPMKACTAAPATTGGRTDKTNATENVDEPTPIPRGDVLTVVGLGNLGRAFEGTRHNAGWDVVGALAARHAGKFRTERKLEAQVAEVTISGRTVLLVRPRTLMNASGRTVRAVLRERKTPHSALLVVADDMALEVGRARMRARGSAGGHNGLRSVEKVLGGREYARLRVGVGEPRGGAAYWKDHVLEPFSRTERVALEDVFFDCCEVIEEWIACEDFRKPVDLLGRLLSNRKA